MRVISNAPERLAFRTINDANTVFTTKMVITNTGNVGIGTTNPGAKLDINSGGTTKMLLGANTSNTNYNAISLNGDNTDNARIGMTGGGSADGRLYLDAVTNITFRPGSSATQAMTILSGGNVGIGTTSPGARLAIQGTGSYGSVNWGTASDMAIRSSEMTDSAYHSILQLVSIRQSLTTGNAANGYLGFSTIDDSNAQGMLDAGRIAIVNESVSSRNSATALSFWTNPGGVVDTVPATEKVRITSAGNVGIGTTNPQTALHISGATPFIMVNGTSTSGEPGLSILNA